MAESKRVIGMDEWKTKLQQVKVRKEDMNKLVMDFLVTEGFADAVEKFQLESGIRTNIDLATFTRRMVVKKAVQDGRIEEALEKVLSLDPQFLPKNPKAHFSLLQQWFIELIRYKRTDEALTFATEMLAPVALQNGFVEELERASLLLISGNGANNPSEDLLKRSHRYKTASVVNEAILISQNNAKEAKLSTLLKMLACANKDIEDEVTYPKITDFSTCKLDI